MTDRKTWPRDLLASLVVFMVALPLCIAIAKACGLPAEAGIVTGIIGGMIVGPLAGSPLQVSGPAAGLIVLVLEFVNHHRGELGRGETLVPVAAALGMAVLLAGLLQIIMAALRLGQWFRAVSPAVVLGMLGGIGVVIIAKQIHELIDDHPSASIADNLRSIPGAFEKAFTDPVHRAAATAGLVTLAVLILWNTVIPKKWRVLPGALLAVVAGTLVAEGLGLTTERIDVKSNLLEGLTPFQFNWAMELLTNAAVWKMAVAIAVIASAETLLCAVAVDQLHNGPRTKFNKELFSQGVGNSLCGLLGALPMTGVIVRSSTNVAAGAKTRLSSTLHGLWLLGFVVLLPGVLQLIPEACLAGVLVYTGFKLLEIKAIKKLCSESPGEAMIFLATLVGVVFTDLLVGVSVGVGLTIVKLLISMSHIDIETNIDSTNRVIRITVRGAATFVSLPRLAAVLDMVPKNWSSSVRLEDMTFVDHSCWRLLRDWERQHGGDGLIEWIAPGVIEKVPEPESEHLPPIRLLQ
ncbi:SulP family inorganic anion transporter [Zavarzinella formosa]|uniref:SulP family inorganic anion transporter n=1 Tax=Zavarzinella formosa TaxID=360055 RepID=UPI0002FC160A|nr:SulP family inorganic anion transporter [Zavarzinella formosa]